MSASAAMERGRRRYVTEQRQAAVRRVRHYHAWLQAGSPIRRIPEIPSDHDFKIAQAARR